MDPEAMDILNRVKSGELSAEEGAKLLQELEDRTGAQDQDQVDPASQAVWIDQPVMQTPGGEHAAAAPEIVSAFGEEQPPAEEPLPDLGWWRKGWLVPFWAGTVILVLSALWMGSAYSSRNYFWFYCSWLPMLFGLLVLFLSWWSQQARWVHVRIKDADGTRVAVSLPLPLGLAGRLLHIFGRFIPNLDRKALENLPEIFDTLAKEKGPTTVEVDEKDGTRVRVYIL
jgi:hypothetical protein